MRSLLDEVPVEDRSCPQAHALETLATHCTRRLQELSGSPEETRAAQQQP